MALGLEREKGWVILAVAASLLGSDIAAAQFPPGEPGSQGSANVQVLSHIPLGRIFTIGDIELEQELSRPYAYVPRLHGTTSSAGFNIISVRDPEHAEILYEWRIEDPELHVGAGCLDNKYFKLRGRYYDVQGCQFSQSGPNSDLNAVVFDVTGLPDTSAIREVGRIRAPDTPGGSHNIYLYKHSDGRVLLFATTSANHVNVYDMERFLDGAPNYGLVGRVPLPDAPGASTTSYHDMYVGYDPATRQDKFYGGGGGGYFVIDVTDPSSPEVVVSVAGVAGVSWGHTFTPTPDGRYVVAEAEYQYAPLRIFDLKPALDGETRTISRPIGAWTARWQGCPHNTEVRWPYVFVTAYEDGFHVFNMMDPANPYTVAYYDTYEGPNQRGRAVSGNPEEAWVNPGSPNASGYAGGGPATVSNGAFGVDVRNADGLIVSSDLATGFWVFRMDGFDGWNGNQWGMPNISSAQDWDNGPEGAPAARVSRRSQEWNAVPYVRGANGLLLLGSVTGGMMVMRMDGLAAHDHPHEH